MQLTLRIALIIITIIYIFMIMRAIKNKKMQISFSTLWIVIGLVLIIAVAIPNMIDNISKLLGFELSVNMIFCAAIFLLFYIVFNFNILLSKENKRNIILIQEISIMKKRIHALEEKIKNDEEK